MAPMYCLASLLLCCIPTAGTAGDERAGGGDARAAFWSRRPGSADEVLDQLAQHGLLAAALHAGGCRQPLAVERAVERFWGFCRDQRESLSLCSTDLERAQFLWQAMHGQILTGSFEPHCYRLDETLGGHSHNCLTTTILFLSICRELTIPATAAGGPTHVSCRLDISDSGDVRSGHADWPDGFAEGALGAWRLRGDTLPDGSHGAGCVQLEDRQLLARIYYNRGTSALAQREFGRAEGHLSLCLELDPRFQPARHNRIVAGNEAVVALCSERQFEQAAELLQICLARDPDNPTTLANDVHLHHGWVMQLCSQRRFLAALRLLEDCHARRPEVEFFDRGRAAVRRAWADDEPRWGSRADAQQVHARSPRPVTDHAEPEPSLRAHRGQLEPWWGRGEQPNPSSPLRPSHHTPSDLTAAGL